MVWSGKAAWDRMIYWVEWHGENGQSLVKIIVLFETRCWAIAPRQQFATGMLGQARSHPIDLKRTLLSSFCPFGEIAFLC